MADFKISYAITRDNEGGWHGATGSNVNDRGGETFKGIARKMWPNWEGWLYIDTLKKEQNFPNVALHSDLLVGLVHTFYKKEFWDVLNLDSVQNQHIANELFDTSVNVGQDAGGRMLQRCLNMLNRQSKSWKDVTIDGKIGPQTLSVLNSLNLKDQRFCFNLLNIVQGCHYVNIVEKNRTQEDFMRGWMERVELM